MKRTVIALMLAALMLLPLGVFAKTVAPIPLSIDPMAIEDGEYCVAFLMEDVAQGGDGIMLNHVGFYTEDTYEIADIEGLAPGDTIIVDGAQIEVETVEHGDWMPINGGFEADGVELVLREEQNVYTYFGFDDIGTYTWRCEASLPVREDVVYQDWSDLEHPVECGYDGLIEAVRSSDFDFFVPYNTIVTVENGEVTAIERRYIP